MTIKMMKIVILLVVGVIVRQSYGESPIVRRIANPVAAPRPIVGGDIAIPNQFRYQVSVQYNGGHFCGGTLITDIHVVTAAHCISNNLAEWDNYSIVTGTTKWKEGERHHIKCIQPHPGFDHKSPFVNHDIALITLRKPVVSNERQAPIRMASRDYTDDDRTPAVASGWGFTSKGSGLSDLLKWVNMKILPLSECIKMHGERFVSRNQICTYPNVGQGVCNSDSGGPLVANGELVGATSWGTIPCGTGDPDVFANVYAYRGFIKKCQQECK